MDNNWQAQKQDFDDLVNLWDKALAAGIFKDTPRAQPPKVDFFGNYKTEGKETAAEEIERWANIISRSGEISPDENTILMEAAKKKDSKKDEGKPLNDLVKTSLEKAGKLSKKSKAKTLANTPNPVYPDTTGSDTTGKGAVGPVKVTAGLAVDDKFAKLEGLKIKLYDLEVQMIKDKTGKSYGKKMNKIQKDIEKISNSFGGNFKNNSYRS
jgi:hypothetical protein